MPTITQQLRDEGFSRETIQIMNEGVQRQFNNFPEINPMNDGDFRIRMKGVMRGGGKSEFMQDLPRHEYLTSASSNFDSTLAVDGTTPQTNNIANNFSGKSKMEVGGRFNLGRTLKNRGNWRS